MDCPSDPARCSRSPIQHVLEVDAVLSAKAIFPALPQSFKDVEEHLMSIPKLSGLPFV
jgi:hypothetical protein